VTFLARGAVFVEESGERELRSVRGQAVDDDPFDNPLREATLNLSDVFLEATDHYIVEDSLSPHLNPPGEAVGIEQLQ